MLSHQLKQFRIDGEKSIIQNPSELQRKEHEKATLETYEVYAMDVLVSTGEGVVSCIILIMILYKHDSLFQSLGGLICRIFVKKNGYKLKSVPLSIGSGFSFFNAI